MKSTILFLFMLMCISSCNEKKEKFSQATDSNSLEDKYENIASRECVVYFYKLRTMNNREGITISTDYLPQKYDLAWGNENLDHEIDSESSKVGNKGSEATFIQITRETNERYKSVEKLVDLAMSTKVYSTCKDYLMNARNECSSKDKDRFTGACFQKRFSLYKYFVSEYIVTKAINGKTDMSKLTSPSADALAEITKHKMILNY